jgi:hypothetical protein
MMDWKEIGAEVANSAPVLGGLLLGPAGGAIGSIIASALGTPADANAVQAALKANPDAAVKLRQIEADQATRLRELAVTAENNRLVDVQNARAMQVAALGQEDVFSKRFVYLFALAWSLFAMAYFCAVTFVAIPPAGQRVADTILGVLISSVIGVMINYFYGSTKGSMLKTQIMASKR